MRRLTLLVLALSCVPHTIAFAEDTAVSRRDGFLILWETIHRPAFDSREVPFTDVEEGSRGFTEITYAKARGLLDDDDPEFRPDAELLLSNALVWLLRTRNVDDPDAITADTLPLWLRRYSLGDFVDPTQGAYGTLADRVLSEEELHILQVKFDELLKKETHEVSLYAEKFHGKGTAFGDTFDMHAMTAAHRTFPANTLVRVTNVANGKSVVVRINDRGPFVEGRDMDLSLGAFTSIESRSKGKFRATFERLGDESLLHQDAVGLFQDEDAEEEKVSRHVSSCPVIGEQTRITRHVLLASGVPQILPLGDSVTIHSALPFLIRRVTAPDGATVLSNRWMTDGETYTVLPDQEGTYIFSLAAKNGRGRNMEMNVAACAE